MDSTDLPALERRVRRRYERTRLLRSTLGFAPMIVLVLTVAGIGKRPTSALLFGGLLFVTGVLLLWWGRTLQRAVLPGVLAGLIPLSLSLAANLGHGCAAGHCSTLCLPACSLGGVVAGFIVSTYAVRQGHGMAFFAGAALVSVLTGAMGCSCIGSSGVVGLVAGFAAGLLPQLARKIFARA